MKRTAIYPGTFDPLTMGHFDLIQRSAALFEKVIVVVAGTSSKATGMFGIEARMAMIRESIAETGITNIEVDRLDCLLVEYCRRRGVGVVVRGLRVYSDFEYEFQMALINKSMYPQAETVFLMTSQENLFLSSSIVKQIAGYGGDISGFVDKRTCEEITKRLSYK